MVACMLNERMNSSVGMISSAGGSTYILVIMLVSIVIKIQFTNWNCIVYVACMFPYTYVFGCMLYSP